MRKQKILCALTSILIAYGMFYAISDIWKLLERFIYKTVDFNIADMIICLLFTGSLYWNLYRTTRKKAK